MSKPKIIIVLCPHLRCRAALQVPETARGKQVRCGHCGTNFKVPLKETRQAAPPAPVATPIEPPTSAPS